MKLSLHTNVVKTASQVFLTLAVPRPDGTEVRSELIVWIGPQAVRATGSVYAQDSNGCVVVHLFERTEEAIQAPSAAQLINSMASRVCAERRFLES